MSLEFADLLGPSGGSLALAWAAGAASGYVFACKMMKSRIDYLEEQIKLGDESCERRLKFMLERVNRELESLRKIIDDDQEQIKNLQSALIKGG